MSPSCPTKVTRTALSVTDIDHHVNKTLSTRARHAFGPRAVPLISSTIASTSKSGIRLQLASSSQLRSRPAMLASRCQTLRARIPRTRSEPTGCAAPSARQEGSSGDAACCTRPFGTALPTLDPPPSASASGRGRTMGGRWQSFLACCH